MAFGRGGMFFFYLPFLVLSKIYDLSLLLRNLTSIVATKEFLNDFAEAFLPKVPPFSSFFLLVGMNLIFFYCED